MGVKVIQKGKAKPASPSVEALDQELEAETTTLYSGPAEALQEHSDQLQQLHELDLKIKPIKAELDKLQKQRGQIEADLINVVDAAGLESNEGVAITVNGTMYKVTAMGRSTEVTDTQAAFDALEKAESGLAFKLMTFPVTKLREYLGKKGMEKISQTVFKSKRSVRWSDED